MSYKLLQQILYYEQLKTDFSEDEKENLRTLFSDELNAFEMNKNSFEVKL